MKRLTVAGIVADLPNTPIGFNWEYLDLSDPGKRYAPFSSSLILPFTPVNNKIMGYGNAVGGRLIQVRNLPNVDFWLGHNKVIEGGYLKVNSSDKKGYQCSITGKNSLIETLEGYDIETAISEESANFTYSAYSNAVNSLRLGLDGAVNSGFILPITLEDPITSASRTIYDLTDGYTHELWVSAACILKGLVDASVCTFKVWEIQDFEALTTSYIYPYLQKLYMPAWNYVLKYSGSAWVISKETAGQRVINSKAVDRSLMHTGGENTVWDLIKVIAQLFCAAIYINGTEIDFIPLNEVTAGKTTDYDLSGKSKNPVKYTNIPGQEYQNFIRYKNTDNLPADYAKVTILAPVNPAIQKDLFTLNAMLPGLYYNASAGTIFNTDYNANSELGKSILFLYDNGEYPLYSSTTVIYEASPSNYSVAAALKKLTYFNFAPFYSGFQILSAKGIYYTAEIYITPYDFLKIKPYTLLRINEIGGLYYLNKIANYDPYSGKLAKCSLVKYDFPAFSLSPDTLSFIAAGEGKDFTTASNVHWKISSYPNWITPEKITGSGNDTITLTAAVNIHSARSGTVVVDVVGYASGGLFSSFNITVSQAAAPAPPAQTFTADVDIFNFNYNEYGSGLYQTCTLTITPDTTFSESNDLSEWCAVVVDQSANTVTIYPLSENEGEVDRTGIITLSCPDASDIELQVTQYYNA